MDLRQDLLKNRWFWLVAFLGLVLDQLTKTIVLQTLPEVGDTFALWPNVFHFTYVQNTGLPSVSLPMGCIGSGGCPWGSVWV